MVKSKCCGKTFYDKEALNEHTAGHPPGWGRKSKTPKEIEDEDGEIFVVALVAPTKRSSKSLSPETSFQLSSAVIAALELWTQPSPPPSSTATPPSSSSSSSVSSVPPHEFSELDSPSNASTPTSSPDTPDVSETSAVGGNQGAGGKKRGRKPKKRRMTLANLTKSWTEEPDKMTSKRADWATWDAALDNIFKIRSKASSESQRMDLDSAIESFIDVRNNCYIRKLNKTLNPNSPMLATKELSLVSIEEHNKTVKEIEEITQECKELRGKHEALENELRAMAGNEDNFNKLKLHFINRMVEGASLQEKLGEMDS